VLGVPAVALVASDLDGELPAELTSAGRMRVPIAAGPPRLVSATLGSAIPLQQLAERLARRLGVNPDAIGRDDPRQAEAADA
jgi:hypothetical protein